MERAVPSGARDLEEERVLPGAHDVGDDLAALPALGPLLESSVRNEIGGMVEEQARIVGAFLGALHARVREPERDLRPRRELGNHEDQLVVADRKAGRELAIDELDLGALLVDDVKAVAVEAGVV